MQSRSSIPTLVLALTVLAGCTSSVGDSDVGAASETLDGPTPVLVNECSVGSGGFIELVNTGATTVDLTNDSTSCWYVDDQAGGGSPKRVTDSVVSHAAGSTTCVDAGRSSTCGLVAPGERVWVSYSYVNYASPDACRLVSTTRTGSTCGTTFIDYGAGGATAGTAAGQCFGRIPDGSAWQTATVTCSPNGASNGCVVGTPCDDHDACTTGETTRSDCSCAGGTASSCDDTNACTADSCSAAVGCAHTAVSCDDANACTADACDPATGCSHTAVACDDADPCTADSCDATAGCVHVAISCGDPCATASCDDTNACTADSCDSVLGCAHAPIACDDGNVCTADACDPASGCASAAVANGTPCGTGAACQSGACTPTPAAGPTIADGAADRVLLRGIVAGPTAAFVGEVLVVGATIACVAPSCSGAPGAGGATVIDTDGVIMPGLIDAHNHGLFNIFDENDWTPTRLYGNHNQWTADPRYHSLVDAKQWLGGEATGSPVDYRCEMDKWAELKALIAGTTSFLVAPGTTRACYASLIRSIDVPQNDLGFDRVQTSISVPNNAGALSICNNYASGSTDAYVVHVAEGIDSTARNEFTTLAGRSGGCLLAPQTTIVHGTALGTAEFTTMAAHDMGLVWSPRSNEFLYGGTARIDLAISAGVRKIALAPDWSIGGSVNMLDELRYARDLDTTRLGGLIGTRRLFDMVTIDAARVLGLGAYLGSIEVGKRADLVVVPLSGGDAYGSLFGARPGTVRLVMVDGRALYGDETLGAAGPDAPGCEHVVIEGAPKFLCVAETSTANFLDQTYEQVRTILVGALADYDATFMTPATAFSPIAPLYR